MLPVLYDEPFDSPDHIYEIKWGGVRTIAVIDGGEIRLHGTNLRDLTPLYPELKSVAGAISAHHAVVDGEIVAWGDENVPAFDQLRSRLLRPDEPVTKPRRSPLMFQIFDVLELNGRWLLHYPLFERRNLLHERLTPNRVAAAADFVREDGIAFFEAVVTHRLEGIIAKDKLSQYLPGQRTAAWQEIRAIQSDNFVIGGYTFGGGRRGDLLTSLLLGAFRSGNLEFVGEVNVGVSDREQRQLLDLLAPLHTSRSPFVEPPEVERFFYWCRPELACHVRYSQWAPDGRLRFPLFVAPRPDVPPEDCVRP
jgi:DNA ligase-1